MKQHLKKIRRLQSNSTAEYCNQNNIKRNSNKYDAAIMAKINLNGEPGVYSARYAGDHALK